MSGTYLFSLFRNLFMSSLNEALKMLEEVEKIINEYMPKSEDKEILNKLLEKNMKIEAEAYAKYIRIQK